jgi:uncharacterized protein YjiS (DUF1127 family)
MSVSFYQHDHTGRIHHSGTCPENMVQYQAKPNLITKLGRADIFSQYVDNDNLLDMPPKPSKYHNFDYVVKTWVPDFDKAWGGVRNTRNELLQKSDWTQLPDVPIDTKEVWAMYRQALRDVTDQEDPFNISWPTPPN